MEKPVLVQHPAGHNSPAAPNVSAQTFNCVCCYGGSARSTLTTMNNLSRDGTDRPLQPCVSERRALVRTSPCLTRLGLSRCQERTQADAAPYLAGRPKIMLFNDFTKNINFDDESV